MKDKETFWNNTIERIKDSLDIGSSDKDIIDNIVHQEWMKEKEVLDKGAIPRLTQEVYYVTSSDGNAVVNFKLTVEEFITKLDEIQLATIKNSLRWK